MKKENVDGIIKQVDKDHRAVYRCPHCEDGDRHMLRKFFSQVYRVEVDQCTVCGYIWFDQNELEVLQYLIEEQTKTTNNG